MSEGGREGGREERGATYRPHLQTICARVVNSVDSVKRKLVALLVPQADILLSSAVESAAGLKPIKRHAAKPRAKQTAIQPSLSCRPNGRVNHEIGVDIDIAGILEDVRVDLGHERRSHSVPLREQRLHAGDEFLQVAVAERLSPTQLDGTGRVHGNVLPQKLLRLAPRAPDLYPGGRRELWKGAAPDGHKGDEVVATAVTPGDRDW